MERVEQVGEGRADHQHSQAIQLFSMTIKHDLRVTLCVCLEGSALFHIMTFTIKGTGCRSAPS